MKILKKGKYELSINPTIATNLATINIHFETENGEYNSIVLDGQGDNLFYDNSSVYHGNWYDDSDRFIEVLEDTVMDEDEIEWFEYLINAGVMRIFSRVTCEPTKLDKSNYLEYYKEIPYSLKTGVSIMNPVVYIEIDRNAFYDGTHSNMRLRPSDIEYVYISIFDRYYFVTDITFVRNNTYQLTLKEDVLYSHYNEIKELTPHIKRCGDSNYQNSKLIDDLVPKTGDIIYSIDDFDYQFDFDVNGTETGLLATSDNPSNTDCRILVKTVR